MDFRFKILCLLVVLCKSAVFCENDEEDDSVVIEAFPQQKRTARQFLINEPTFQTYNPFVYTALNAPWSRFPLATTGSCITSKGAAGKCTSFRQCYPYFKLPELNNFDSWVLGMYDTCSYYTPQGRQMFGVCCAASQETSSTVQPPEVQEIDNFNNTTSEDNAKNQFLDWPPPLPTHPPDHTIPPIPTHPPHHTAPTHPNEFSSTAWPPKPPTVPPVTSGEVQKPSTTTRLPTYPTYPTYVPSRPPTTKPTTPSPVVPAASCGAKNGFQDQERIVGGHNADVGEWPWIAALFNGGRQFCGGSLIDSVHILSAAHCVAHMSSWDVARLTVRLGDHNIKSNSEVRHIEKRVKRVVRHRGFDGRTLYNDIAILTLDSPVAFNQQIRPICLPTGGGTETTGRTGTVIGWGSIREMGPQPAILQEVNIPIWSNRDCKLKYGPAAPGGIVDHMLCAGQDNRDSCSGDSGGPLMVNSGKWTQVGIVSWGIGCGKGQYPGVYTRVEKFLPWINKNLK